MRNFLLAKRPQRRRAKEKRMLSQANGQEVAEKGERERKEKEEEEEEEKKNHKQLKF